MNGILPDFKLMPKIELHDHLDGGLRPLTILELAAQQGINLPESNEEDLSRWFARGADRKSLPQYLEGFKFTVELLQTEAALFRAAEESILDLASDGCIYAEIRFAPELHTKKGLKLEQIVEAVIAGTISGRLKACNILPDSFLDCGIILCAMRNADNSLQIAKLAEKLRFSKVCGFDIAGPEAGFPPSLHAEAFDFLAKKEFPVTIHAGEAAGPEYIAQAVLLYHAARIGHGINLINTTDKRLIDFIQKNKILLEICPSSNIHTGATKSIKEHPFKKLLDLDITCGICSDNRLMSRTTLSNEILLLTKTFELSKEELLKIESSMIDSAFCSISLKKQLFNRINDYFYLT